MVKVSKGFRIAMIIYLIVAVIVTGCSKMDEFEKPGIVLDPNKKVKLKYYTSAAYDKVEFDVAYPEWQKLHPNIEVELIRGSEVEMALIAGEQIDVIFTGTVLIERADPDSLYLTLDELVRRDGWDIDKEFGDYLQHVTMDGKLYGIPRSVTPDGIWFNKRLFKEAGIADPSSGDWTWDEFFRIAKKLSKYDGEGKNTVFGLQIFSFLPGDLAATATNLALYGGWEIFNDDGTFNQDWTVLKKALEYLYKAVYVDKSMAGIAEILERKLHWQNDFYANKNAMAIGGRTGAIFTDLAREYGQISPEDDDAGIHSLAPMPRWDSSSPGKQAIEVITADAISKTTKYPEEAYTFVKWHATQSIQIASKAAHRIPASKLLDKSVLLENWRYFDDKEGKQTLGKTRDDLYKRMMDPEIKPIFKKNSLKYTSFGKMMLELEKQLSDLFNNEITVDQAIERARKACESIYLADKTK